MDDEYTNSAIDWADPVQRPFAAYADGPAEAAGQEWDTRTEGGQAVGGVGAPEEARDAKCARRRRRPRGRPNLHCGK